MPACILPFKLFLLVVFATTNIFLSIAQTENPVISIIKKEVDGNFARLKSDGSTSPFFISYAIIDQYQMLVEASFGTVTQSCENRTGWGMPTLYVGSYLINNERMDAYTHSSAIKQVNLDDAADLCVSIREALDNRYSVAVRAYEKKTGMLNQMKRTPEEAELPDFEKTPVVNLILPPEKINANREYWEMYARNASAIAKKYPEIIKSDVTVDFINGMTYYYNTEGSQCSVPAVLCKIVFVAKIIANDGEELQDFISILHSSTDRLPDMETFMTACEKKIVHLIELKNAPIADKSYTGPVLCEKEALANGIGFAFFNNAMMVWQRDLDANYSNLMPRIFETEMGESLISDQLTVKSLSGTKIYKGQVLDGYIPVDCEGVIPAEELMLIENGVLKNMLNGRIPSVKNPHSNGHNRFMLQSAFSHSPVFSKPYTNIYPGVIQFTAQHTITDADLKRELIKAARNAGLEYAYIVKSGANNEGIRVYVKDGREELVRGLYNPSYNHKAFQKILGASADEYISTSWHRGAVSSYIFPKSMLFEELEIHQKQPLAISKPME